MLGHRIIGANDPSCRPDALLKIFEDCVTAATLVPAGQICDEYRADCLYLARVGDHHRVPQGPPAPHGHFDSG
jgi:hypothetical protein